MTELAPGWPLVVEETTDNHCVASCRNLVLVFAYEGSHDDVRHVDTGMRVVERLYRQRKETVRLLFALSDTHTRPPSAPVRGAMLDAAKRNEGRLSRCCLVAPGAGFGAAIHRGAVTGIVGLLRVRVPFTVTSNLRDALVYLLGDGQPVIPPLLQFCEERRRAAPSTGAT